MSRPRRNVKPKSYVAASSEDEIDTQMGGSAYDSDSQGSSLKHRSKEALDDDHDLNEAAPSAVNNAPVFSAPLTASQIQQTRAVIVEQTTQLRELRAQYEQYQNLAQAFEKKIQQCEKELFESRSKLAPINRVPPEILGDILVIHVRENGGSPWLPMQVSRAWRATALLTRCIWSGILLAPATQFNEWGSRACDGRELCTTGPQLIRALNRAGQMPLDLKIALAPSSPFYNWQDRTKSIQQKTDLCILLDIIKSQQQIPRIRSIELDTADAFVLPDNSFDAFSFAPMESLNVDAIYSGIALKVVKESTHLRRIHIPLDHANALKDFPGWHQVEELKITSWMSIARDFDLSLLLSRAINLTSLDLHCLPTKTEDSPFDGQEPDLISLKHLYLRYSSHRDTFWPVLCPNLTHLVIENISERTATFALAKGDGTISLPLLAELSCSTDYCSFGFLRVFQAPALCKLVLHDLRGKANSAQGVKELWALQPQTSAANQTSPSGIEPTVIHLREVAINSKLLGRILAERKAMTEFSMEGSPVTTQIFQALIPVYRAKGKGRKKGTWIVGCPKLKVLRVDFSESKMSDEAAAAILEGATTLVTERAKAGKPLERFSIRIYMIEPWRELVDIPKEA